VAVASVGPYANNASLFAADRQPHQHPTTLFFTGRMPFLPPNQQRQSTEGKAIAKKQLLFLLNETTLKQPNCYQFPEIDDAQ